MPNNERSGISLEPRKYPSPEQKITGRMYIAQALQRRIPTVNSFVSKMGKAETNAWVCIYEP
jgi:hypothetical protein